MTPLPIRSVKAEREDNGLARADDGATHPDTPVAGRRGFKSDAHARRLFGSAYDAIPKSVFATMAYYLAGNSVDSAEDPDQVDARLLEEIEALTGQIIPERQGNAAIKAMRAAIAETKAKQEGR